METSPYHFRHPALSRNPAGTRLCGGKTLSIQGLGLAGCRIKSGMTGGGNGAFSDCYSSLVEHSLNHRTLLHRR